MSEITVYCRVNEGCLPVYRSPGAVGADLKADIAGELVLKPGERRLIPTGLRLHIPPGFEAQVRPRSGLAAEYGITLLNSPGTIDSDYRGEIKVIMINLGSVDFHLSKNDRIAQIVFAPVMKAEFKASLRLDTSARGEKGFGSTGVREKKDNES